MPEETVQVAELDGVPLETAFLWADTIYLRRGRELPAATQIWFRAPRCTSDGEFDLIADWLGVTGPKKPRFDGDLRPPYRLQVHVTQGRRSTSARRSTCTPMRRLSPPSAPAT